MASKNELRTPNTEVTYTNSFGNEQRATLLKRSASHPESEAWDLAVVDDAGNSEHVPGVSFSPEGGATTFRMGAFGVSTSASSGATSKKSSSSGQASA